MEHSAQQDFLKLSIRRFEPGDSLRYGGNRERRYPLGRPSYSSVRGCDVKDRRTIDAALESLYKSKLYKHATGDVEFCLHIFVSRVL